MVQHIAKRFAALSIRSKLLIGFGVLIILVVVEIGISIIAANHERRARNRITDVQNEVVQTQDLRIQMLLARQFEYQSFINLFLEGYEASYQSYSSVLEHVHQARTIVDELKGDAASPADALVNETGEGRSLLLVIDQGIADYQTMVMDLVTVRTVQRGTLESGLAGDFMAELYAIEEHVDATQVVEMGTSYVESFSTDFTVVFQIPAELGYLEEEVQASELDADTKAELLDHIAAARTNFVALAAYDVELVSQINTMSALIVTLNDQIEEFVQEKLVDQVSAEADFTAVQQTNRNATTAVRILSVVVALLFAFIIARNITVPLKNLDQTAQQFAAGHYDQRAVVMSKDEIGTLAATLNSMAEAVSGRETELRKTAEDLRIASQQAREAERIKGEFLATMSHELRTPLNAIIGFTDLLVAGMVGEVTNLQRDKLERLQANAIRLLTLINDILDLSRIEAGRAQIKVKPFSPATLAHRVHDQVAVLAEEKDLGFEMVLDHTLPDRLEGDEKRIEQIVINLLSNAFKFTEKGSVELYMSCDPAQAIWCIEVKDTGVGIAPHARELIFEPFRQVDGSSTRLYPGTGLGLTIVQNLVRLMEGQIQVESTLGEGTTFTVTLPLKTPQKALAAAASKDGRS